jgi:hypothetical protein
LLRDEDAETMTIDARCRRWSRLAMLGAIASLWMVPAQASDHDGPLKALVRLAADRIDVVFREVAASTRAIGEEYRMVAAQRAPVAVDEKAAWAARSTVRGSTAGFRTWPQGAPTPAFQAPFPGFYRYGGTVITDEAVARLREFERLVPVVRAAYNSFDFSWVYLTTADEMMLIYPYVPIEEAVNNGTPTRQVFYTAADFARRDVGWTAPYLDLVGAGLMITASYPIYDGDRLLGVVSHDITLKQLSRSVLAHLSRRDAASAYLVDPRGLAIAASDPKLEAERERVNGQSRAAVLYYRSSTALTKLGVRGAVASRVGWVNDVTERVLARSARTGAPDVIDLDVRGRKVLAASIASTGWFVVLVEHER